MKISQIIQETTTSGSVAPVELGFVKMQTRNPSVYGGNKVGNLLKGKKTSKPFANSVNESKMKDLAYDMEVMKPAEFQKKYGKSREQMKASPINKPAQPQKTTPPVNEADLSEQDLILVPGQGHKLKPGFIARDKDRTDHEVEMAVSDLFSAGKNAEKIYNIVRSISEEEGLEGWVQEKIIKANDYLNTVREYLEGKQVQSVAEGFDPASHDYSDWLNITRKETRYSGKTDGANSLEVMAKHGGDDITDVIRNILAYVKQNRQELGREVSEETGKTVKDAIIDIKNKFPQQYQAAQQPQGVAEGSEDYQEIFQMNTKQGKVGAVVQYKDKSFGFIYGTKLSPTKFARAREAEQALNAYHNKQGVVEGSRNAYLKHNNLVDIEKPLAGLKSEFEKFLQTHDPEEKQKYQQGIKQRIKTRTMAGPKGVLPEQGVAEGAKVDRMVKHIAKSEKKLGKSKDEAENIAWATANKRGMLDNKNKKK